jgi:cell division protein FtsZ
VAKRAAAADESGGVTVFGIGGAGGNAVAALLRNAGSAMKIVCADTDVQALQGVAAGNRLQLGRRLTAGLGAGAGPEIGHAAAEEALPEIEAALAGSALCCIAVGLGGGTGTGAAPVIARAARARGIVTIGVVTRPFAHEGKRQARIAATGATTFAAEVDLLVSVCNQQLLELIGPRASLQAALDRGCVKKLRHGMIGGSSQPCRGRWRSVGQVRIAWMRGRTPNSRIIRLML